MKVFAAPFALFASLALACGGETVGQSTSGSGSGSSTSSRSTSSSTSATTSTSVSSSTTIYNGRCVDFVVGPADTTCASTSDCTTVSTGEICNNLACNCGATPVNSAAGARFASETASIGFADCPCASPGQPSCIGGQCVLCGGPDPSPMCHSVINPDASVCVDIEVTSFDTTCVATSDCISITAGEVCSGSCQCGGATISASAQAQYNEAISGITGGECACPLEPSPSCIAGHCVVCGEGSTQPGCPDGGF